MTLGKLKQLQDKAFARIREQYPSLDAGDLQSIAVAYQYLNELVREILIREEAEYRTLNFKARVVDKLLFCPDHRDKVAGKSCRECEIERLTRIIERRSSDET